MEAQTREERIAILGQKSVEMVKAYKALKEAGKAGDKEWRECFFGLIALIDAVDAPTTKKSRSPAQKGNGGDKQKVGIKYVRRSI